VRLASLHVYPVKALRGFDTPGATVEPWGLAGDRRYMVVGADAKVLTQRAHPVLTQVFAGYGPDGALLLHPLPGVGLPELRVPVPAGGELVEVGIWRSTLPAMLAPAEVHAWFSKLLGVDARLVYLDDPTRRAVNPKYGTSDDRVSFADGYPLLLTSRASLDRLNDWLLEDGDEPEPLPMNRFRPSIVVGGAEPFAEDGWHRVRVGDVEFRVVKPCDRCVVTQTDQDTGVRGRGPLRALARHRTDGLPNFGQNLIPDGTGRIFVNDPITVLS
jgi:MOSC domain-containing protein